ncbi:FAM172A family protein [Megaselia abdita]
MSTEATRKTIKDFGYTFSDAGFLRKINDEGLPGEEGFEFNISSDHSVNQKNYDALGETITDHVYKLLEENGLHRIYLSDKEPKENNAFVFSSQKELDNPKKLIILIHGSGVVRAGQWARSLIINQSIDHGTMLPYVKKARDLGYEVLITNGNDNHRIINGKRKEISGSKSPEDHARTVFEQIVVPANPESIAIVAHSYGGVVTMSLARNFRDFFKEKVFSLGFTDSVHFTPRNEEDLVKFLHGIGRNFVSSPKPLNEKLSDSCDNIPRYSAGHVTHEWTSYSCRDALFEFLEEKYSKFLDGNVSKKPRLE